MDGRSADADFTGRQGAVFHPQASALFAAFSRPAHFPFPQRCRSFLASLSNGRSVVVGSDFPAADANAGRLRHQQHPRVSLDLEVDLGPSAKATAGVGVVGGHLHRIADSFCSIVFFRRRCAETDLCHRSHERLVRISVDDEPRGHAGPNPPDVGFVDRQTTSIR